MHEDCTVAMGAAQRNTIERSTAQHNTAQQRRARQLAVHSSTHSMTQAQHTRFILECIRCVLLCCCAAVLLCCCAAVLLCCCAAVLLCCCAVWFTVLYCDCDVLCCAVLHTSFLCFVYFLLVQPLVVLERSLLNCWKCFYAL